MITVGRVSSICPYASRSASRSCPPRLRTAAIRSSSGTSAISRAMSAAPGALPRQVGPDLVRRAPQHALVLGVAHRVDAVAQRGAAGTLERCGGGPPVLAGEPLPAGGGEHALQAGGAHGRDDAVQRLPVEVDDPDD